MNKLTNIVGFLQRHMNGSILTFDRKVLCSTNIRQRWTEIPTCLGARSVGQFTLYSSTCKPEVFRQQPFSTLTNTSLFPLPFSSNCGNINSVGSTRVLLAPFSTNCQVNIVNNAVKGLLQFSMQAPKLEPIKREMASLQQMHRTGPHIKNRKKKRPLDGNPFMKGVVLKTLIKKPKKPNSANRKCVQLRLSNGKEMVAHVPGEGHNLQEHHIVLVRVGRLKDVPGVKLKVVRGKYDCAHVIKKIQIPK